MHAQREGFIVKIRAQTSEAPVGVGVVVGDRHIVTCAHVVNAALGRDKFHREPPSELARIQVEFVLLGDGEGAPLRVCRVAAWDAPPGSAGAGRDIAGLVIVGGDALPRGAGPARLVDARVGVVADAPVSVFGFARVPERRTNGAWSTCVFRGSVGGGLIQLDTRSEAALRAQPGYSGAPVIATDRWGDVVVGLLAIAGRTDATQDAYAIPLPEVAAAWGDVLGRAVLPPCPYRGLQTFTPQDAKAGVFVGREREVKRLQDMVKAQPLVMVTGPSGVGKSSLVAAGLHPVLENDGWKVSTFRPGAAPYESLARALLDLENPGASHSLEQLERRVCALREEGLWPVASKTAVLAGKPLALVGDQFEEVLSGTGSTDPLQFLQHLLPPPDTVQDPRVRLVCTLRADFLPDLLELPDIGARLQDRQLNVSPLNESALTRVIVEPAHLTGVTFTPGLAEKIAAEASRSPGSLPLLEFALTQLWPLQNEWQISFDSYYGLGGVSGALNQHAEKVYQELRGQLGLQEHRIRRVLLSMVRARGGAASAVRVTAQRSHLGNDWSITHLLADPDRRLVVLGSGGPETAEIAHEALIREWGRLAAWVEEDAVFQQWLAVMEERARDKDLLSATRVAEAQRWLGERRNDIPQDVADFIEHSSAVILEQQQTQEMLSQSQELTDELRRRSAELESRQKTLQDSNAELEEKAELLAQQNRDIEVKNTEIEEARQVLEERAEQLAVSMRYKVKFLANVSHELRTPLNSLLILAKLLADNADSNLTPKQVEFAETIHGAGSDLLQLINDILDLSRIEAGKMSVSPTRIALVQLVDYVEATFHPLTAEKGLDFSVRVSPELPATLHTDEQRLLQVLRNLLSNAVKFTNTGAVELVIRPAGTDVPTSIRDQLLELDSTHDADDDLIAFCVRDTGIGIAPDELEMIFEAFTQGDIAIVRRYGGTGLGLSIAREVAHLLGGEIHAESEPGRGSTFTLYLPLDSRLSPKDTEAPNRTEPARPTASEDPPSNARVSSASATARTDTRRSADEEAVLRLPPGRFDGNTVLIVDDDIRNVFALTCVLEKAGLSVLYAENGREGIEVLEDHNGMMAVLLDIMMPDMDGYATTTAIRKMPQFARLPIIALTAKAMPGDREKAIELGFSNYLTKPVNPGDLISVLHACVTAS